MAAPTTTVRVSVETRDRLRRISERRGVSTRVILDELATQAEELHEVREWAEDLRCLPDDQRRAYAAEIADWGAVAGDGFSDTA